MEGNGDPHPCRRHRRQGWGADWIDATSVEAEQAQPERLREPLVQQALEPGLELCWEQAWLRALPLERVQPGQVAWVARRAPVE